MVLRVTAQLCRDNCTYVAGETVRCKVLLENLPVNGASEHVTLAWCSAQIICRCSVNDSLVKLPKSNIRRLESEGNTSFFPTDTEKGQTVLALSPSILCCDLQIPSCDRRELTFTQPLPFEIPASYNGRAVRYFYKLLIGVQLPLVSTKLLRISFRVVVVPGLNEINIERYEQAMDSNAMKPIEGAPSNPFLRCAPDVDAEERRLLSHSTLNSSEDINGEKSLSRTTGGMSGRVGSEPNFTRLEVAVTTDDARRGTDSSSPAAIPKLSSGSTSSSINGKATGLFAADLRSELVIACASHLLGELAGASSLHQFTIATQGGRVCRFYLHKSAFRLGESVVGAFDFAGCDVRCHRVVVRLESEESIEPQYLASRSTQPSSPFVTCQASLQQTVTCLRTATFELEIPSDAPAEVSNELVTLRWRIRFEFHVVSDASVHASTPDDSDPTYTSQWRAPRAVETKATEWTLPIRVYPCSPLIQTANSTKSVAELSIAINANRPESGIDVI